MDRSAISDHALLAQLWQELGGPASALAEVAPSGSHAPSAAAPGGGVHFTGTRRGLPSVYEVSTLASSSIAAATLAIAELHSARTGKALRALTIDRAHADTAFQSERHLRALGWQLPEVWDPLAGDYPTQDGFIRLHTNYSYHRAAVLKVLGLAAASVTREQVAAAVSGFQGEALEHEVVAAGGCAGKLRSPQEWREHPQGQSLLTAPLFELTSSTVVPTAARFERRAAVQLERSAELAADSGKPLSGVRVLDLTRVIAGPIGTRFLAAYGADVLRIDPPSFAEVGALLCDITAGKRRAALDLREAADRERFLELVRQADVIVHGYRGNALSGLGLGNDALRAHNPNAVIVCHNAYGWTGPWSARRGFDSVVQMSCGIAWRGREVSGSKRPTPLPAQALDHATGYLIASAVTRALTRRLQTEQTSIVRLSLARTARLLMESGDLGAITGEALQPEAAAQYLEEADTRMGRVRRVRCPGEIAGVPAGWTIPAGPLGVDPPRFALAG